MNIEGEQQQTEGQEQETVTGQEQTQEETSQKEVNGEPEDHGEEAEEEIDEDDLNEFVDEVEDAPAAGSVKAATLGVQEDASGHFESTAHVRSDTSGTRV